MASEEVLRNQLLPQVQEVAVQLQEHLGNRQGIEAVLFFANPPWKSKDQDLDVVVIFDLAEAEVSQIREETAAFLQTLSGSTGLVLDTWLLTRDRFLERMTPITRGNKPIILDSVTQWEGFGFVAITGKPNFDELLTQCYESDQAGQGVMIPPNDVEMRKFFPQ